ncbi:MAG: hypothetical protein ABEJ23_05640 [Haloarculaceae archaeon]
MAPDSSDGQVWGWTFFVALALTALAAALVNTTLQGPVRWVALGAVVLAWLAYVTVSWWPSG